MAKLNSISFDKDSLGFYASFTDTVMELPQGSDIYLQLPDNADSQHDDDYSKDTADACVKIIKGKYNDELLSLMAIIGDMDLDDLEIKNCTLQSIEPDGNGNLKEVSFSVQVLKNNDDFYAVKDSSHHKYYTNNFAWTIDTDNECRFGAGELEDAFNESNDVELSGKNFNEEQDENFDLEKVKELPIEDFKSNNSKGFFLKERNRPLTAEDVQSADGVSVCIDTGTNYHFYYPIDKDFLIKDLSKKTITCWRFEDSRLEESLGKPKGRYQIIIGDRVAQHV